MEDIKKEENYSNDDKNWTLKKKNIFLKSKVQRIQLFFLWTRINFRNQEKNGISKHSMLNNITAKDCP